MLILKAFVNHKQIDEIHIQRTDKTDGESVCTYEVRKPGGLKRHTIHHYRPGGWRPLAQKVLAILPDLEQP